MAQRPLGVILTGGLGTRLRPLTPATPKALVPLLNRPLLAYALDRFSAFGLTDTVVVVGGAHEGVAEAAAALAPPGLAVSIAEQLRPLGIGDAVTSVGSALDGRTVVVLAIDTILIGDCRPALDAFERAQADAGLLLHPTDRPREMGIAVLEGDHVVDLVEKPQQPRSNLAAVGLWMLGPAAVERLRRDPSTRADGEIDLTGTIAAMLADGADVRGWELDGEWLDSGAVPSLLSTQARLLADLRAAPPDAEETRIEGAVAGGEDVRVTHSTLRGPLLIGAGVEIDDCELGPNVVIGDGASLRSVRLSDALVAAGATLEGVTHAGVVVNAASEVGR
jgi:glucose-1-phosphate thymidylyltransferase